MLFGKKEDISRLPDLPPMPKSSAMSHMQSTPSFPDLPVMPKPHQNQEMGNMIQPPGRKDVMMNPPTRQEQKPKVVEMEEWHPRQEQEMDEPEDMEEEVMEEPVPIPRSRYTINKPQPAIRQQAVEDVFVRIDKFHSARKSLGEIQNRLADIDELVRRIRDTKMREEQELAGWEKELMNIKARIQNVTETIFEKVE